MKRWPGEGHSAGVPLQGVSVPRQGPPQPRPPCLLPEGAAFAGAPAPEQGPLLRLSARGPALRVSRNWQMFLREGCSALTSPLERMRRRASTARQAAPWHVEALARVRCAHRWGRDEPRVKVCGRPYPGVGTPAKLSAAEDVQHRQWSRRGQVCGSLCAGAPVSYTHLTLPTKA